eukprot:287204-Pelagomonas_calceolata.AAC.2
MKKRSSFCTRSRCNKTHRNNTTSVLSLGVPALPSPRPGSGAAWHCPPPQLQPQQQGGCTAATLQQHSTKVRLVLTTAQQQ